MANKTNLDYLKKLENNKLDIFVDNYIKNNLDPIVAYKKTFDKQLWQQEIVAKERALTLINTVKFIEKRNEKIDNLRELYKEEISNSFNLLNKIIKDDTYESHEHYFDINTLKPIEYKVKRNIKHSDKIKAAELMLKVFNYFEKNTIKIDINQDKNEFEIIDAQIENILNENNK